MIESKKRKLSPAKGRFELSDRLEHRVIASTNTFILKKKFFENYASLKLLEAFKILENPCNNYKFKAMSNYFGGLLLTDEQFEQLRDLVDGSQDVYWVGVNLDFASLYTKTILSLMRSCHLSFQDEQHSSALNKFSELLYESKKTFDSLETGIGDINFRSALKFTSIESHFDEMFDFFSSTLLSLIGEADCNLSLDGLDLAVDIPDPILDISFIKVKDANRSVSI